MGAPTSYFVDPAGGSDGSGDGSIGNPWQTIQHALDNITRDSTNGDKINIKSGSDDVLSAELDISSYGTPTGNAPLYIRGYSSSEDDDGIGVLNGNDGGFPIFNTSGGGTWIWENMRLRNCGSAGLIFGGILVTRMINCEIDGCSGDGINATDIEMFNCYIHNIGGDGASGSQLSIIHSYFRNTGSNEMDNGVQFTGGVAIPALLTGNIFNLSGSSNGAKLDDGAGRASFTHNSFYTTGTGKGIVSIGTTSPDNGWENDFITNNLLEGWGTGISIEDDTDGSTLLILGNAEFNCGTGYSLGDVQLTSDNESLGASPFSKSGIQTFNARTNYFFPVDTGNVLSPFGGIAYAKGAVQVNRGGAVIGPLVYHHRTKVSAA